MNRTLLALGLVLTAGQAQAAAVLDGKLDEPEWQTAQPLGGFKVTEPYTQAEPGLKTTALVYTDEDGIHVGVTCQQPPSVERARTRGQRDQFVAGDRINLIVDFDGSGTIAYELTAYLGGGEKQDAIISQQTSYNYDWDGDWDYAVAETADAWTVEYRIPWNIAAMGEPHDGKQTVGIFVARFVVALGQRFAVPANSLNRATFVRDLQKVQIAAHERDHLELFPYAAAGREILNNDDITRAGLDVFWKPNGRHQLTASINPDFGQVESDQLVTNLTAIPTFYPDKRPFFTENLGLFTTDVNVLYTRRIGAAPDCTGGYYCTPSQQTSDIRDALKYTGSTGSADYGAILAQEFDTGQAQGRDFYVGRARYRVTPEFSVGWMGTHTEKPTLHRIADVNAVDFSWNLAEGINWTGQALYDDVEHDAAIDAPNFFYPDGDGSVFKSLLRYAPGGRLEDTTVLLLKSRHYDINDAGFQQRPSEFVLQSIPVWYWRDWAADSALQQVSAQTNVVLHTNAEGQKLQSSAITNLDWVRRDTRFGGFEYDLLNVGGVDDVVTCGADVTDASCGHAPARLPVRHQIYAYYDNDRRGIFRYQVLVGAGTGSYASHGMYYTRLEPGFYPSDKFSLTMSAALYQSPDEILSLTPGPTLDSGEYEQQDVSVDLNWFPATHHELRLKTQWSAYTIDPAVGLTPAANGDLVPGAPTAFGPFSFTRTAMQLRYRWEFRPQSDLYFVYTHGGEDALPDTERSMGASIRRGFAEETASQVLLKVRYRFVIL